MSVKITDNTNAIILSTSRKAALALRFMLDDMHEIANPKTPKAAGNLRGNVKKSVLGLTGKIAWLQGYAVYQETKQFRNYTTAGTGPHFAESSAKKIAKTPQGAMRKAGLI